MLGGVLSSVYSLPLIFTAALAARSCCPHSTDTETEGTYAKSHNWQSQAVELGNLVPEPILLTRGWQTFCEEGKFLVFMGSMVSVVTTLLLQVESSCRLTW